MLGDYVDSPAAPLYPFGFGLVATRRSSTHGFEVGSGADHRAVHGAGSTSSTRRRDAGTGSRAAATSATRSRASRGPDRQLVGFARVEHLDPASAPPCSSTIDPTRARVLRRGHATRDRAGRRAGDGRRPLGRPSSTLDGPEREIAPNDRSARSRSGAVSTTDTHAQAAYPSYMASETISSTGGRARRTGSQPDPEPRAIRHTLFSTDDHLVEPPQHVRGPAARAAASRRAARSSRPKRATRSGSSTGKIFFQVGLNAVVGRKREDWKVEPTRFEEMRPGCYDIDARIRDMDINGVWASVNFPSQITGFCGAVFSRCSRSRARARGDAGVERLVLRGVVLGAPRAHRPDGHHVPRRRRAGRRGDPPQRGARLHRGDAARDAAPHRHGADLLGRGGTRSSPRAPRPTR